jgi:hypothetical protein
MMTTTQHADLKDFAEHQAQPLGKARRISIGGSAL